MSGANDSPMRWRGSSGSGFGGETSSVAQEPERIREDFSRILEGIQPPGSTLSAAFPPPPPLNTLPPGHSQAPFAASGWSNPSFPNSSSPATGLLLHGHAEGGAQARATSPGCLAPNIVPMGHSYGGAGADPRKPPIPSVHWDDQYFAPEAANEYGGFVEAGYGASELEASKYDAVVSKIKHHLDLYQMFPFGFSMGCFISFLMPFWLVLHLSQDPSVVYWVGHWCESALLLPSLFVLAFLVHTKLGRPHKPTVLLSILVPAISLLIVGDILNSAAADKADQLRSTDCDTFSEKRQLQRSWDAAHQLYMGCLQDTLPLQNLTMDSAMQLFRIQDCEEYTAEYGKYAKDWEYLWYLEEEHNCAGWCSYGQRLWTYKTAVDSCTAVVSQMFVLKVRRMAKQVIVMSVMILVATSAANILLGPGLRAMGVTWDW